MNHQDTKTPRKDLDEESERIAAAIVDSVFKIHMLLGPGLLESVYQACLAHELRLRGFEVQTEVALPVIYEGIKIDAGFRLDLVVNRLAIIELKAVEKILPVHEAQLLTYLKISGIRLGFLINFNVPWIKDGIRRRII